jgi:hypothetical protein
VDADTLMEVQRTRWGNDDVPIKQYDDKARLQAQRDSMHGAWPCIGAKHRRGE